MRGEAAGDTEDEEVALDLEAMAAKEERVMEEVWLLLVAEVAGLERATAEKDGAGAGFGVGGEGA